MKGIHGVVLACMLAAPLACGDAFSENEDDGDTSTSIEVACRRFCAAALGCPDVGEDQAQCEEACLDNLGSTAGCAPKAARLLDCYRDNLAGGCGISGTCLNDAMAYGQCIGMGCEAANMLCGNNPNFDCWCTLVCPSQFSMAAQCNNNSAGEIECSCRLTGPLVPYAASASIEQSCTGTAVSSTAACDAEWGCCRGVLEPGLSTP